jgi:hypothetical protein
MRVFFGRQYYDYIKYPLRSGGKAIKVFCAKGALRFDTHLKKTMILHILVLLFHQLAFARSTGVSLQGFIWYSLGLQIGLSASISLTSDAKNLGDLPWNWLDNGPNESKSFGNESLPSGLIPVVDSCSCGF